jgi:sugar phosphate permease
MEQPHRFFYGWVIVFAGLTLSLIMYGVIESFAVMFKPIAGQLAWDRGAVSVASMINWISFGLAGLVCGALSDLFGSRRVILFGGLLFIAGTLLMSRIQTLWHLYLCFGILLAIGRSAAGVPLTVLVTKWFTRYQGLALALVQSQNIGSAVFAPLAVFLLAQYGWRDAYLWFGLGTLIIVPLALLMRDHQAGTVPVPQPLHGSEGGRRPLMAEPTGLTLSQALRTRAFWTLNLMVLGCCMCHSCLLLHGINHITDVGLAAGTAARVFATMAIFGMLGKIANGLMADRIGAKWAIAGFLGLQGLYAPLFPGGPAQLVFLRLGSLLWPWLWGTDAGLCYALSGIFWHQSNRGDSGGVLYDSLRWYGLRRDDGWLAV